MILKDTEVGRELLQKKLLSLNLDKHMASCYEKHLNINLNSKKLPEITTFEDIGRHFLSHIALSDWEKVRECLATKNNTTANKIIERLKQREEFVGLEYFIVNASGTSKDGTEAFSSMELDRKYDLSIIFKNIDGVWFIDNLLFGEINLIYSETDTIKHIAYALSRAEYDRAYQLLTSAEKIYFLSPDIQYYFGLYHSLNGKNDTALSSFAEASLLDPTLVEAFYNQAFIHHSESRVDLAIEFYEKTIELDLKNLNALNNLGTIYIYLKDVPKAKSYFQKCLEINPDFKYAADNLNKI
jgi:tetratricopeptide (TPR) repeat protein